MSDTPAYETGLTPSVAAPTPTSINLRGTIIAIHSLYAASIVIGFPLFIGVVVAYLKRADAADTIYQSHMTYAIRTFWMSLIVGFVTFTLCFLLVGFFMLPVMAIWYIVRVVRPFLAIMENRPIQNPTRYF